jgi:hypothetical protein
MHLGTLPTRQAFAETIGPETMHKIEFYQKSVYGRNNLYLVGPVADVVTRLTGKVTVTPADLADLARLTGADVVQVVDPAVQVAV